MTILTIEHGLSKYSAFCLSAFGAMLCGKGDKLGYRCGKLALDLIQKMKVKEVLPQVYGTFYGIISPWYSSIHDAIGPMKIMHRIGLEIGSQENTAVGAMTYCMYALLSGMNLVTLMNNIEEFKPVILNTRFFLCLNQAVLNLQDLERTSPAIIGELFDYKVCFDKNEKDYDIIRCLVICTFTACIFNDYELALKFAEMGRPLISHISSFFMEPTFLFYDGLVSLASVKTFEQEEKTSKIQHSKEIITRLKKMSVDAPMNYLNKVHLLEAELAVINNNTSNAVSCYQSAIELSVKHNFLHEEALIRERAAMYHITIGSMQEATQLLLQSFSCYKKWGAVAKLKNLIIRFPNVFDDKRNSDNVDDFAINMELENHSMASMSTISAPSCKRG